MLSCHDPPGIRAIVYNSSDQVTFVRSYFSGSHVISGEDIPFALNVTVEQISEGSIFIQVCAHDALFCDVYRYEWWLYMCYCKCL